jgi:hypothetical protein
MAHIDNENDSVIRNRCLAAIGDEGGDGELLFFEGLDAAIIGVGSMAGGGHRVVYDRQRCIELLEALVTENAEEYFEHNVETGYIGSATPLFLTWIRNEA